MFRRYHRHRPKSRECLDLILKNGITIIAGNHELYYKYGIEIDNKITEENEIKHHKWIHSSIQDLISREDMNFPLSKELNFDNKKILFQHYMLNEDLEKDSLVYYGVINNPNWDGYAFKLINIEKIKPIPINGKLSLWNYDYQQNNKKKKEG